MKIDITLEDTQVVTAINRMIHAGTDLTPVLRDIGEHLLNTTRERFRDEEGPDGEAWMPLSETTKARKTRNIDKVLTEDGHLAGTLDYLVMGNELLIGSPRIYASTHQFGALKGQFGFAAFDTRAGAFEIPWGDIPARPFLGISDDDRSTITDVIGDFLRENWR